MTIRSTPRRLAAALTIITASALTTAVSAPGVASAQPTQSKQAAKRQLVTLEVRTVHSGSTGKHKSVSTQNISVAVAEYQHGNLSFEANKQHYRLGVSHLKRSNNSTKLRIKLNRNGKSSFDLDAHSTLRDGKRTLLARFEHSAGERTEVYARVN